MNVSGFSISLMHPTVECGYKMLSQGERLMWTDDHVHTCFSDDGKAEMEQQILQALQLGLDEICFTEHVDYGVKKDWSEGNIAWRTDGGEREPLANVDYPAYFAKIEEMRAKYGKRIQIHAGLEFGVQMHTIGKYEALLQKWKPSMDGALLSIHEIQDQEFWTQAFQRGKSQLEYNRAYYEEMKKVMEAFDGYSVLAHLDLIVRYDLAGVLPFQQVEDLVAEILKLAIENDKGIELNTSSWRYGLTDTQPSRAILKLYRDIGGRIVTIGSDAHSTLQLGAHLKDAHEILKYIGYSEFCTFELWQPVFHRL